MAYPSTFLTLQTNVIARLNLDATADLTAAKDALNAAYGQICIESEALTASGTITMVAGTAAYDLSSSLSAAVRIKAAYLTSGGVTYRPLTAVSFDRLLRLRVGTGGTAVATGPVTHYALVGMNDLEVWPTPAAADTLTVFYVKQPTALSGDTDVPAIPEPYATRCLTFGACAELADLTGDPQGDEYRQLFDQWTARFREHLNRRRSGQPGAFEEVPGGNLAPHDPATIVGGFYAGSY